MAHSLNSSSFNRRRSALRDDIDRSAYTAGQTLASVVNDPRTAQHTFSWGFGSDASKKDVLPPIDPAKYPPVSRADVQQYLKVVSGTFERFLRDRHSLEAHDVHADADADASTSQGGPLPGSGGQQGEAFVQAMQQVPLQYFQEDFEDKWHDFFVQFCQGQDQDAEQLYEQIDELNKYLDTVEMQLLKEVAARSNSFFRAASSLQHLRGLLCDAIDSVRGLRRRVGDLDGSTYSTAVAVRAMQNRRQNLVAVLDVTKALEDLLNCQQALDCLLESQDYAGALDLLDNMTSMLANPVLAGLQCIRHLPPQVKDTIGVVENMLVQEFVVAVSHSELPKVVERAVIQALQEPAANGSDSGTTDGTKHHQQHTPQTASSAAAEQLHDKLLPLVVGLHKADKLGGAMQQYKENAAAEVKSAVRDVVQRLLPALLAATGDAAVVEGLVQGAATEAQLVDQLQMLQHGGFMALLSAVAHVIESCMERCLTVGAQVEDILKGAKAPASQLQSVRRDTASTLQQVVDVGQGRWVKLLAARTNAHMRLKLYELRQLLDVSEAAAAAAEARGAKPLPSYRMALQAQCKAFLDNMHGRSVMQLQHLLEAEQWVVVEVPGSFQQIVDRLVARCEEGLPGNGAPAAAVIENGQLAAAAGRDGPSDSTPGEPSGQEALPQRTLTLHIRGKRFHLCNSSLMLLKLLDEYLSLHDIIPTFGAEIVHRLLELLKLFNTHTCQLVLGAGAMRTAGLKSISAKQLALSCQCVAAVATLQPLLRACSLATVSAARRALLMPEFDRLLADLNTHMDEVHSKLVDIMADRLAAATKQLPAELTAGLVSVDAPAPVISTLARQMMTLKAVLGPILLPEETEYIFGCVTRQASEGLAEAFEGLVARGASWEPAVRANALHMLRAFKELPLDKVRSSSYTSRLSTFYTKHFGLPPEEAQRMSTIKQQQLQQGQQQQAAVQAQQQPQQQQPQLQEQQEAAQPSQAANPMSNELQQQERQPQQEERQQADNAAAAAAAATAAVSEQDAEQLAVVAPAGASDQQEEPAVLANGLSVGQQDAEQRNGMDSHSNQQPMQQQPQEEQAEDTQHQDVAEQQEVAQPQPEAEQQHMAQQQGKQQLQQPAELQEQQQEPQQEQQQEQQQKGQRELPDAGSAVHLIPDAAASPEEAAPSAATISAGALQEALVAPDAPAAQAAHDAAAPAPSQQPPADSHVSPTETADRADAAAEAGPAAAKDPSHPSMSDSDAAADAASEEAPATADLAGASTGATSEPEAAEGSPALLSASEGPPAVLSASAAGDEPAAHDLQVQAAPGQALGDSAQLAQEQAASVSTTGASPVEPTSPVGTAHEGPSTSDATRTAQQQQQPTQAGTVGEAPLHVQPLPSTLTGPDQQHSALATAAGEGQPPAAGEAASGQLPVSPSSAAQPLDVLFAELGEQQQQQQPPDPAPPLHQQEGSRANGQQQQHSSPQQDLQPPQQQQQQQQLRSVVTLPAVDLPSAPSLPPTSALAAMVAEHVAHSSALSPTAAAAAAAEDDPLERLGMADAAATELEDSAAAAAAAAVAAQAAESSAAAAGPLLGTASTETAHAPDGLAFEVAGPLDGAVAAADITECDDGTAADTQTPEKGAAASSSGAGQPAAPVADEGTVAANTSSSLLTDIDGSAEAGGAAMAPRSQAPALDPLGVWTADGTAEHLQGSNQQRADLELL